MSRPHRELARDRLYGTKPSSLQSGIEPFVRRTPVLRRIRWADSSFPTCRLVNTFLQPSGKVMPAHPCWGRLPSPTSFFAARVRRVRAYFRFYNGWATHGASEVTILAGERQNLTVEAQKTPQEVVLTMVRAGVISGHVRDADGKLLVNAQVGILASPDQGAAGKWVDRLDRDNQRSRGIPCVLVVAR